MYKMKREKKKKKKKKGEKNGEKTREKKKRKKRRKTTHTQGLHIKRRCDDTIFEVLDP